MGKQKRKHELRNLDRQENSIIEENTFREKNFNLNDVDIGLDISTSCIGVTVLAHHTGELIKIFPIKLTSSRLEDLWDKMTLTKDFLNDLKINYNFNVKRVFVEDVAKKFTSKFSSASTIVILAKANAIVCYQILEIFGVKPTFINVRSARKVLGIKIDKDDKTLDTKQKVFNAVRTLHPEFPWLTHVATTGKFKGQTVYDTINQDMGDSWVICRAGQLLHPII